MEETKEEKVSESNATHKLLSKIERWKKQKRWAFISPQELGEIMLNIKEQVSGDDMLQVIDVRHSDQDYIGGHIKGSTNIDYRVFEQSLPITVSRYAGKLNFVMHCMYSQCRGLRCLRAYRDYIENLIGCRYYEYLKDDTHEDTNMTVKFRDLQSKQQSFKLTADLAENIMNQNIWVLKGGFNAWLTYYYGLQLEEREFYISDFDESYWSVNQDNDTLELKHKKDWN